MPRKRMIDPEFWTDEAIGNWGFASRLFYIGLWNFADDSGRFKANLSLLKAQIFPYDEKIDFEEIKMDIGSKVLWYEHEYLQYGYIRNFNKYQRIDRPTPSKLPTPPQLDECSTSVRRSLDPNIIEDKLSKDNTSDLELFDFLWSKYPSKDGKKSAVVHFLKSVTSDKDRDDIQLALKNYLASDRVKKGYIKNGSTWFNNWRDWIISPISNPVNETQNKIAELMKK
jgi:hypothetical protein